MADGKGIKMDIIELIEKEEKELKNQIENDLSIELDRQVLISPDDWYRALADTINDIKMNKVYFDKAVTKEYFYEVLKKVLLLSLDK